MQSCLHHILQSVFDNCCNCLQALACFEGRTEQTSVRNGYLQTVIDYFLFGLFSDHRPHPAAGAKGVSSSVWLLFRFINYDPDEGFLVLLPFS